MKFKAIWAKLQKQAIAMSALAMVMMMTAIPAFATSSTGSATLDPTLFDPLVSGVTSNISLILPKVLIVVAMLVGLGVVIALFKKHAKPS